MFFNWTKKNWNKLFISTSALFQSLLDLEKAIEIRQVNKRFIKLPIALLFWFAVLWSFWTVIFSLSIDDTHRYPMSVQTGTGKVDPARKFKCTMAARGQDQILTIQGVQSFTKGKLQYTVRPIILWNWNWTKMFFFCFVIFVIGYLGVWLRPYLKVEEM